jgi:hypothetical protein
MLAPTLPLLVVYPHIILFAMFIKALRIPLRGRALSRWSAGLNDSSATVTLGASMPVRRGSRCTLSRPSLPSIYSSPSSSTQSTCSLSPFMLRLGSSKRTRFGVLGAPSARGCAKEDCRFVLPIGRDPGGAGDADVVRDDDAGDWDRCRGLAFRSCSGSESLSEGCSCRSFWLSLIVASSEFREG